MQSKLYIWGIDWQAIAIAEKVHAIFLANYRHVSPHSHFQEPCRVRLVHLDCRCSRNRLRNSPPILLPQVRFPYLMRVRWELRVALSRFHKKPWQLLLPMLEFTVNCQWFRMEASPVRKAEGLASETATAASRTLQAPKFPFICDAKLEAWGRAATWATYRDVWWRART